MYNRDRKREEKISMKKNKYFLYLTRAEKMQIIEALTIKKNDLLAQGKYTDAVDEILLKIVKCKTKKLKLI